MPTHSNSLSARGLAILAILLIPSGCSRRVPATFPTDSAASVEAEAAPPVEVTLALDGQPPLPGEDAEGWFGLEQPSAAPDHSHHGHGHHGHHGEPAKQPEQKTEPKTQGGHHHGH